MAGERASGNQPANTGGGNANKGPNRNNNNRRRSLRSKRRARKPDEGVEARDSREPRESRLQPAPPKPVEKNVRDNRDRRRRRRMRAKQRGQNESSAPVVEDVLKDLPPLVPAFVYTHVIRPGMRDSFEFRTEHFSKVTRKLEDFHIDLSPLYPDGGDEIKGVAYMPPTDRTAFGEEYDDEEGEGYDDPDWDAEESGDAARMEGIEAGAGAIADDFYEEMDDSVIDEYPEEDIDA